MKSALFILSILFLFAACHKRPLFFLNKTNGGKKIALQPLGDYDAEKINKLRDQLTVFFNIPVVVLAVKQIPDGFRHNQEKKYAADSLLKFLSALCNDSIVQVIGIMHEDIYVGIRDNTTDTIPVTPYREKPVFGFGHVSGNSCVISDYRLSSPDVELSRNRLRKVVIHEAGHNLGLQHCAIDSCLMSEANGNIAMLNKTGGDYCRTCRRKLR